MRAGTHIFVAFDTRFDVIRRQLVKYLLSMSPQVADCLPCLSRELLADVKEVARKQSIKAASDLITTDIVNGLACIGGTDAVSRRVAGLQGAGADVVILEFIRSGWKSYLATLEQEKMQGIRSATE